MATVFIGVDPHKLSVTIEVVDGNERVLATGRFGTDKAGHSAMRKHVQVRTRLSLRGLRILLVSGGRASEHL